MAHNHHSHCDSCLHEHHDHDHHSHGEIDSTEKLLALLNHMCLHNESHAGELERIADKLRESGKDEAASLVKEAFELMNKSNSKLRKAYEEAAK